MKVIALNRYDAADSSVWEVEGTDIAKVILASTYGVDEDTDEEDICPDTPSKEEILQMVVKVDGTYFYDKEETTYIFIP